MLYLFDFYDIIFIRNITNNSHIFSFFKKYENVINLHKDQSYSWAWKKEVFMFDRELWISGALPLLQEWLKGIKGYSFSIIPPAKCIAPIYLARKLEKLERNISI